MVSASTFFIIIAPAPIIEFSPMIMPGNSVAPAPIKAPLSILFSGWIGSVQNLQRKFERRGWVNTQTGNGTWMKSLSK